MAALAGGVFLGGLLFSGGEENHTHEKEVAESVTYTCSMHPQIRQNEPGQCPICGMDLVPVSQLDNESDTTAIQLSSSAMRLGNIRTTTVGYAGSPEETLTLNGRVVPDENMVRTQTSHVEGRIERLFVATVGEEVRKGQRIATIYSPKLIAAQQELLQAADMQESHPQLLEAAREKLRSFRLTDNQINQIIASGTTTNNLDIYAEFSGTVLEKMVNVGDHLMEGSPIYLLADLSRVWVQFDAYESDLPVVNVGDEISFTVSGIPGRQFQGEISFIDPVVDPRTRVAHVRVVIPNEAALLKPEMFVKGTLRTSEKDSEDRLLIPRTSVLWTGPRSIVYVRESADGEGATFRMQEVVLGPVIGDYYVVENGLAPGADIVVNGTFTVDAAAQLAGKPSMMNVKADGAEESTEDYGEASQQLKDITAKIIRTYTSLKDYLVASDYENARKQSEMLLEQTQSLAGLNVNEQWASWLSEISEKLEKETSLASNAGNVDELRSAFIGLSENMVRLSQRITPLDETLYVMRCPMANNNQGARWLSFENEVRNPYYGDMMLTCGSVTETIK